MQRLAQGLALLVQELFAGSGGAALVEAPTYDRALILLARHGADVEPVPLDDDGLDIDAERCAPSASPAARMVYTIPNFQNPAGVTLSGAKRERLVALARAQRARDARTTRTASCASRATPEPPLFALDGGDNVVYSTSFTKTVAPGLRTGYLVLPERLVGPIAKLATTRTSAPTRSPRRRSRPTARAAGSSPTSNRQRSVSGPAATQWSWR